MIVYMKVIHYYQTVVVFLRIETELNLSSKYNRQGNLCWCSTHDKTWITTIL